MDDAANAGKSDAGCLFQSKKAVNFHGFFALGAIMVSDASLWGFLVAQ